MQSQRVAHVVQAPRLADLGVYHRHHMAPAAEGPFLQVDAGLARKLSHQMRRNELAELPQHCIVTAVRLYRAFIVHPLLDSRSKRGNRTIFLCAKIRKIPKSYGMVVNLERFQHPMGRCLKKWNELINCGPILIKSGRSPGFTFPDIHLTTPAFIQGRARKTGSRSEGIASSACGRLRKMDRRVAGLFRGRLKSHYIDAVNSINETRGAPRGRIRDCGANDTLRVRLALRQLRSAVGCSRQNVAAN